VTGTTVPENSFSFATDRISRRLKSLLKGAGPLDRRPTDAPRDENLRNLPGRFVGFIAEAKEELAVCSRFKSLHRNLAKNDPLEPVPPWASKMIP
jgi:hypothetical protein